MADEDQRRDDDLLMANDIKGEVGFDAGGKSYIIKFSTNAICEAENILRKSIVAIMAEIEWVSVRRVLLWAALLPKQPGTSLEVAGEIMDALGPKKSVEVLTDAFNAAFPAPAEGADGARP